MVGTAFGGDLGAPRSVQHMLHPRCHGELALLRGMDEEGAVARVTRQPGYERRVDNGGGPRVLCGDFADRFMGDELALQHEIRRTVDGLDLIEDGGEGAVYE